MSSQLIGVRKYSIFLLGGTRAEKGWEPLVYATSTTTLRIDLSRWKYLSQQKNLMVRANARQSSKVSGRFQDFGSLASFTKIDPDNLKAALTLPGL